LGDDGERVVAQLGEHLDGPADNAPASDRQARSASKRSFTSA
jgi:hypothetical protein